MEKSRTFCLVGRENDPHAREAEPKEQSDKSPVENTAQPSITASDKKPRHVRWNETSQKRDSYVAAITTSGIDLDKIGMTSSLGIEEIALLRRDRLNSTTLDGKQMLNKKVDFVLAYTEPEEDSPEERKISEMRETYEENLKKQGLLLERVPATGNQQERCQFVLIHAPWEVLTKCAEEMMIRAPLRDDHNDPIQLSPAKNGCFPAKARSVFNIFQLQDQSAMKQERPVTAFFSRAKSKSFLIEDKDTFFSDNDRSRMTHRLLLSTKYSSEMDDFGITNLLYKGVYSDAYPLHENLQTIDEQSEDSPKNERQRLRQNWASFRQWFKYQPLNDVKKYFGTRVAFYFAWLGLYNSMLIVAALVGLWCFIAGLGTMEAFTPVKEICDKNNSELFYMCPLCDKDCSYWTLTRSCDYAKVTHLFDHEGTVFFAVFMSLWATVFLQLWRRREISLAYKWDMLHFEEAFEPPRPAFVAKANRKKPNPVTGKLEPYIPFSLRLGKLTCAFVIVSFMVVLVIGTVVGVVIYRAAVVAALSAYPDDDVQQGARVITSLTASVLNLLAITVLGFFYEKIAVALTEWEAPRTRTEYLNILTVKLFVFQSVNMYASLFYIAFFKTSQIIGYPGHYRRIAGGRMEGCDPSGCFIELCIQLAVIMVGKQFINSIFKFAIPSLLRWWNWRSHEDMVDEPIPPQWEKDYLLNSEPELRMFYEYHDMAIQFGFVTMFVAAFPLAPLFALINNILELRIDATNFVVNFRKPVAERSQGIGVWFGILRTMSWCAVVVNSFVIAFTAEFIPRMVYTYAYSPDGSLTGYVNNSLSYFNVSEFSQMAHPREPFKNLPYDKPFCRYKDYFEPVRDSGYRVSRQYFYVLAARLGFVIIFQYFVFFTVAFLDWLIPDVPYKLQVKMKRENYVAKDCLSRSEADTTRDFDARGIQSSSANSVYMSCENVARPRHASGSSSKLGMHQV